MAEDYELDLSEGKFAALLGFEKKNLRNGTTFTGGMIPDITRSVDWVFLHCHLVSQEVPDVESDVLFSLSTVDLKVSFPLTKRASSAQVPPNHQSRIDSVRIRVTDGRNNPIDLNGVDLALSVVIDEDVYTAGQR